MRLNPCRIEKAYLFLIPLSLSPKTWYQFSRGYSQTTRTHQRTRRLDQEQISTHLPREHSPNPRIYSDNSTSRFRSLRTRKYRRYAYIRCTSRRAALHTNAITLALQTLCCHRSNRMREVRLVWFTNDREGSSTPGSSFSRRTRPRSSTSCI